MLRLKDTYLLSIEGAHATITYKETGEVAIKYALGRGPYGVYDRYGNFEGSCNTLEEAHFLAKFSRKESPFEEYVTEHFLLGDTHVIHASFPKFRLEQHTRMILRATRRKVLAAYIRVRQQQGWFDEAAHAVDFPFIIEAWAVIVSDTDEAMPLLVGVRMTEEYVNTLLGRLEHPFDKTEIWQEIEITVPPL